MSFAHFTLHRYGDASLAHAPHRISMRCARFLSASLAWSLIALASNAALAQVGQTWNSGGGADGSWSNAANWGGTLPTEGPTTSLTFGSLTGTTILNQDLGTPFELNWLQFNRVTPTQALRLTGDALLFSGADATIQFGGTGGTGVFTYTIENDIIIGGDGLTILSTGTLGNRLRLIGSTITTTGTDVTLTLGGISTGSTNLIQNSIQGNISLVKTGPGFWNLSGNNTFTGNVTIQGGTLRVTKSDGLGQGTELWFAPTNTTALLSFNLTNSMSLDRAIMLAGTGTGTALLQVDGNVNGTVTIDGTVTAISETKTLQLVATPSVGINYLNSLVTDGSGTIGILKSSAGTWAVTNTDNSFTGGVTIAGGALRLALTDGVLQGIADNSVRFGSGTTVGVLELNGTATFDLGTGANQVHWGSATSNGGGFSAAGGDLTVLLNPNASDTTLIWNNTADFARTGSELHFGSTTADSLLEFMNPIHLSNATRTIRLADNPTTGNDVTWISGGITSLAGGGLSLAGSGTLVLSSSNHYQSGTTLAAAAVNVILRDDLALGEGRILVRGGVLNNDTTAITLSNEITLSGNLVVAGSQSMTFLGELVTTGTAARTVTFSNTFGTTIENTITLSANAASGFINTLAFAGAATNTVFLNGSIVNSTFTGGVLYSGPTVMVNGDNTYSAGTTITGGRVFVNNLATAFGSGTLSLNGGLLHPMSSGTITNAVNFGGAVTLSGPGLSLTIDGPGVSRVTAATSLTNGLDLLTIDDELQMAANFTVTNGNAVVLNGGLSVTGTTMQTFFANNAGGVVINNGINLSADGAVHSLTLRGTGAGGLTVNGEISDGASAGSTILILSGTVVINGSNSYTGGTTLHLGMLGIGNDHALGTGQLAITGSTAILRADGGPRTIENNVVVLNNFSLSSGFSLTLGGDITVSGGNRAITISTGNPLHFTGNLSLGESGVNRILTLTGNALTDLQLLGDIVSGTGAAGGNINFAGGNFLIAGNNTYGGVTGIASGTLTLASDNAFGSSLITWTGGTLRTDTSARTVNNNIALFGNVVTNNTETLTLGGTLSLTAARTITALGTAPLVLGDVLLNTPTNGYAMTLAGSGPITMAGIMSQSTTTDVALSITNSGGVTMLGNNTYGGLTTVAANATLLLGDGTGTAGNLSGTLNVSTATSRVVFRYNDLVSFGLTTTANIIGALGGVEVNSAPGGGVIFDRVNTYTGVTTITQGTLQFGIDNALAGVSSVFLDTNGVWDLNGYMATITSLSGDGGLVTNNSATGSVLSLTSGSYSGVISGTNLGVNKIGAGILTLGGANTFGGTSTLTAGTIVIAHDMALGNAEWNVFTSSLIAAAAHTVTNNLNLWGNLTLTGGEALVLGGNIVVSGGDRQILNNNITTSMSLSDGTILLSNDVTPQTLTLTGAAASTLFVNSTISDGVAPGGSVAYVGGTFIVAGNNTYSGLTSILSGTVSLASANPFGSSEVRVTAGTLRVDDMARTLESNLVLLGNVVIAGSQVITLSGTISASAARTITINNTEETIIHDIVMSPSPATFNITLAGSGPVTLTGVISQDSTTNAGFAVTNTGGVTVLNNNTFGGTFSANAIAGTVTFGDGVGTAGNLSSTLSITSGGRAVFNYGSITTFGLSTTGNIIGAGGVEIMGAGLRLDKTNAYTGGTTLHAGATAVVAANNAFGTGLLSVLGGTIAVEDGPRSLASAVTLFSDLNVTGTQALTVSGVLTNSGGDHTLINNNTGVTSFTNVVNLSETGGTRVFTVAGEGAVVFTSTVGNGGGFGSLLVTNTSLTGLAFGGNANYSGMTTVATGARLQIGNGAGAGSLSGDVTLSSATSLLAFNRTGALTYTGIISGLGSVELVGTGTISLSNASTYSGVTTLAAGTLIIANDQALGDSELHVVNGSLLSDAAGRTLTNAVNLLGTLTLTGGASNLTLNGVIDGIGGMVITAGTNILNGTNSFSGNSSLAGGTLIVQNDRALGDAAWRLTGGTIRIDSAPRTLTNHLTISGTVTLTGDAELSLGGSVTVSGANATLVNNVAGPVTLSGAVTLGDDALARALTLTGPAAGLVNLYGDIGDGAVAGGSLSFNVANYYVAGDNAYSGITSIISGTVTLGSDSAFGNSAVRWTAGSIQTDDSARVVSNTVTLLGNVNVAGAELLTISGTVFSTTNRTINITNTAGLVLNNIDLAPTPNAFTLTLTGPGSVLVMGTISQAANTNAGVSLGTLGGATIQSDGLHRGNTTVQANVTLTLGTGVGTAGNLSGTLNLAGGTAILNYGTLQSFGLTSTANIVGANGNVEIRGPGIIFDRANTYTGVTTLTSGELRYGVNNALSVVSSLVMNAGTTLNLNGFNAAITTLSDGTGGGYIVNNVGASVLTLSQGFFSGTISGVDISFRKFGPNTLTLLSANQITQSSSLHGGKLLLGNNLSLGTADLLVISGALESVDGPRALANNITLSGALEISGTEVFSITSPVTFVQGATRTLTVNNTGTTFIDSMTALSVTNRMDLNIFMVDGGELVIGNVSRGSGTLGVINLFGGNSTVRFTGTDNNITHLRISGDVNLILQGGDNALTITTNLTLSNNGVLSLSGVNQSFTTVDSAQMSTRINNIGTNQIEIRTNAGNFAGLIEDGTGTVAINKLSTGTFTLVNDNTFTGPITITAGTLQIGNGGPTGSLQASSITHSGALIWNSSGNHTFNGDITGTGVMTFTGGGNFTLNGSVTYTGITTVGNNTTATYAAGTVRTGATAITVLNNATLNLQGAMMGNGPITLTNGSRLAGTGFIGGIATAALGSNIFPGGEGTVGTLTLGNLTLAGGALNFDLGTESDLLVVLSTTQPNITAASILNINAVTGFTGGLFTLMSGYNGNITTGSLNQLTINGPSGYSFAVVSTTGSFSINFMAALQKIWTGSNGNIWDVNTTSNFTLSGDITPTVYLDGDSVIFDDSSLVNDITISNNGAAVVPTSVLIVNAAQTYTFRGDPLGGSNGLDKQGSGILVLANDNTFTGGIQVSGGTLQLGDGGLTGSITPTLSIQLDNESILLVNRSGTISLSGNITGSGSLVKTGDGVLNLSGTQTYLGHTTILGGTLQFLRGVLPTNATSVMTVSGDGANLTLAASNNVTVPTLNVRDHGRVNITTSTFTASTLNIATGTINVDGGTFVATTSTLGGMAGALPVFHVAIGSTLTFGGNVLYDATDDPLGAQINGPGTLHFGAARNITVSDSASVDADGAELTINTFMTAASTFNKFGAGTLYLTNSNAITGQVTVSGGTLMVGNDLALGSATINLTVGMLRADATDRVLSNVVVQRGHVTIGGNANLTLTRTWTPVGNLTLTINNSALTTFSNFLIADGNQTRTTTIAGSGHAVFDLISAGTGTGNDTLIFRGTGTYDLLGVNTQSGFTHVRDGTVRVFNQGAFGPTPGQAVILGGGAAGSNPVLLTMGEFDLTQNINVSSAAGSVITLGNLDAVTSTFSGTISLANQIRVSTTEGGTVAITNTVFGVGGITKIGDGTLLLRGNNTFTGNSTLFAGLLQVDSATALGLGGRWAVNLGSTLDLNGFATTFTTLNNGIDGGGVITSGSSGPLEITAQAGLFSGVIQNGTDSTAILSLHKTTAGVLVLTGDNTYTGDTTISAGTLQLGNGGTAGSIAGQAILNNALLVFNRTDALTYAGVISGTGSVQIAAGNITFGGDNIYTGATTIAAGAVLNLGNGGATGSVSGTVSNAGLLTFNHNAPITFAYSILGAGDVAVQDGSVTFTGSQLYTGLTTIQSGATLVLGGTNGNLAGNVHADGVLSFDAGVTFGRIISGAGDVVVNAPTVTFTNVHTYTGITTITAGNTLVLSGTVSSLAGSVQNDGQFTFNRGAASSLSFDQAIDGLGGVTIATGTVAFTAANAYSGITTVASGANLVLTGSAGNLTGDIVNLGAVNFDRTGVFGSNISGTGVVRVAGGTVTYGGTAVYTGATQVNGGTLLVNGSLGTTTVAVAAGATLGGSGSLGGAVNLSGGDLEGTLAIAGAVTSTGGSINPGGLGLAGTLTMSTLILSGGTLNFDIGAIGPGFSDQIQLLAATAPVVTTTTLFDFNQLAGLTTGTYSLISGYTGNLTATNFSRLLIGSLTGFSLTLQNDSGSLNLVIDLLPFQDLVWTGSTNGSWDLDGLNWAGDATTFANGNSNVEFNNDGSLNNISVTSAGVQPLTMTVNNDSSHNYLFTGGAITGADVASSLYKDGDGTLVFANDVSFSGGAIVNGGTLQIGNGGASGSFAGNIINNAAIVFGRTDGLTYSQQISGTGDVSVLTGSLTFANAQSYTGATTVASGALLQVLDALASPTVNIAGVLQLNTNVTQTYDGVLAGAGFLQKLGTGTTFLTGANTFNGITSIDAGTLFVNQALSGTIYVNTGGAFTGTGASGSTVIVNGGSGSITGTQEGELNVNSGTVTIASGGVTTGTIDVGGGSLIVQSSGSVGNTFGVNVTGGVLNVNSGGAIVGSGQITVTGGTFIANGNVSGLVVVNSGTLQGNGGTVGAVVINDGGTFSPGNSVGTLTVDGADVSGGAFVEFNGGGNIVFEFNNATGTFGGSGVGGWDYVDLVASNGMLNITATYGNQIDIRISSLTNPFTNPPGDVPGAADNFDDTPGTPGDITEYYWKFVGLTDASKLDLAGEGSVANRFNVIDYETNGVFYEPGFPNGNPFERPYSALGHGTFKVVAGEFDSQGYGLYIYYSAIPEPGSMILAGLGSLAAGWYGRRRLRKQANEPATEAAQEPAPPFAPDVHS